MGSVIIIIVIFCLGFWLGKHYRPAKPAYACRKTTAQSQTPISSRPVPDKYQNSRWQDRDELFWGMVGQGISLERKEYLTTVTEKAYFDKLNTWFSEHCWILCQISFGRLLKFPEQKGFSEEECKRFFTLYNGMSVDFVLVSKKTNKIVCIIELDDPSHELPERKKRDRRLDQLFIIARIPYLHIPVEQMNDKPEIWRVRDSLHS